MRRPAAPASSSVPSPASSSATVLLVDDEAPIRNSLGPYLERSGHRVLLAGDGVEALDLLGAYDVDIVVTDVLMGTVLQVLSSKIPQIIVSKNNSPK